MSSSRPKPVLGLIGAIGAGKTAVAGLLAARGAAVIDADKLGHTALERPDVKPRLVARWGDRILKPDGTVNRRVVGGIVFADPKERAVLESIVFPVIGAMVAEGIAAVAHDSGVRFIVLDAAVMLEAGWAGACDKILYVDADRTVRLARLAARSRWTSDDLAAREAAQMPAEQKKPRADAVVINNGSMVDLAGKLDRILKEWGLGP
ncbi:MAG TPA: dephospho-CoA kinase [Fimbriiglobus sp.]|jgi:dephospho-CoA kinase